MTKTIYLVYIFGAISAIMGLDVIMEGILQSSSVNMMVGIGILLVALSVVILGQEVSK